MNNVATCIKELLYRVAGEKNRELVIIALSWKTLVGDLLYEKSKIAKFENKILFVKAINHIWLQELVLLKPMILESFNKKSDVKIDNIVFTL